MKNQDPYRAGLWYTLFSESKIREHGKFSKQEVDETLSLLVAEFNHGLADFQNQFLGHFDGVVKLAEATKTTSPPVYLRFPDFTFDFSDFEKIKSTYNLEKIINSNGSLSEKDVIESIQLIDIARIDINPCLNQLSKTGETNHKTKIYVILWHQEDIPERLVNNFLVVCEQVASVLAETIQGAYMNYLRKAHCNLEEKIVKSRIITSVYYSDAIENEYQTIIQKLKKSHSVKKKLLNHLWSPLITSASTIRGNRLNFEDFDPFLHDSVIEGRVAVQGVYGITSWTDQEDIDTTFMIGVSRSPRMATFGVHLPVIIQQ